MGCKWAAARQPCQGTLSQDYVGLRSYASNYNPGGVSDSSRRTSCHVRLYTVINSSY